MRELAIDTLQYGVPEGIAENIRYSNSLGLPELTMPPCANGGTFILCGSGPSIKNHIEDIKKDQEAGFPVCGIKGAYDFLRENDVTPDLYVSVEPRYRPIENPSDRTTYLLASRCHSQMFDDLKDYAICLWHSWSNQESIIPEGAIGVGGGSTSGLRALNIAYILGFKKVKMYGMDSCLGEKGEKRVNQEPLSDKVEKTDVIVGDRTFIANMAMAAQAQDFQMIYKIMPGIHIEVVGGGLLAAIIEERQKQGFVT